MERPVGFYLADRVVNRLRMWKQPHLTPAHLLQHVFERASCFAEAKTMLSETPIALPTIYILAGVDPAEACVIGKRRRHGPFVFSANGFSTFSGCRATRNIEISLES
jgi:hypothetical protein